MDKELAAVAYSLGASREFVLWDLAEHCRRAIAASKIEIKFRSRPYDGLLTV
jgi:hypothetical protein